jgi:AraC family transcriptional regulator
MNTPEVKIVELEPLHVASFQGYGTEPEHAAFAKLTAWLEKHDMMSAVREHRVFGFNNPEPSPGSPNYGYEVWITVGSEAKAEGDMEIKDFRGGLYAVSTCVPVSGEAIPACWQELVNWLAAGPYGHARHQWLEEHIWPGEGEDPFGGQLILRLYAPISK